FLQSQGLWVIYFREKRSFFPKKRDLLVFSFLKKRAFIFFGLVQIIECFIKLIQGHFLYIKNQLKCFNFQGFLENDPGEKFQTSFGKFKQLFFQRNLKISKLNHFWTLLKFGIVIFMIFLRFVSVFLVFFITIIIYQLMVILQKQVLFLKWVIFQFFFMNFQLNYLNLNLILLLNFRTFIYYYQLLTTSLFFYNQNYFQILLIILKFENFPKLSFRLQFLLPHHHIIYHHLLHRICLLFLSHSFLPQIHSSSHIFLLHQYLNQPGLPLQKSTPFLVFLNRDLLIQLAYLNYPDQKFIRIETIYLQKDFFLLNILYIIRISFTIASSFYTITCSHRLFLIINIMFIMTNICTPSTYDIITMSNTTCMAFIENLRY
ncbi:hypothetical protein IMG5_092100, partial [Ichthyophthirius multifiliis]